MAADDRFPWRKLNAAPSLAGACVPVRCAACHATPWLRAGGEGGEALRLQPAHGGPGEAPPAGSGSSSGRALPTTLHTCTPVPVMHHP